jgi:hypothetical protein
MRNVQLGQTIRVEGRGPPWIVVNETPASIITARWPGTLWKAMIVEAATIEDQRSFGGPPLAYAKYTRCISLQIIEKLSAALLFGAHGEAVVQVLNKAHALTREQAVRLSTVRHADAPNAYDRTFRRWVEDNGIFDGNSDSFDGTLQAGPVDAGGSPIGGGLSLVHGTVFRRAERIDGTRAMLHEEDGTPYLDQPWAGASAVLLDAALALGAPQLTTQEERNILLTGWATL